MEFHAVRALEGDVKAVCGALDPDDVPLCDVEVMYDSLARTEKLVAGAKLRLARRLEETGSWERKGHASPAHLLAAKDGTGVGQAAAALTTSRRLPELSGTDEALREGRLSERQAAVVADAATAAPDKERDLVALAGKGSLGELQQECGRVKAAADRDGEARRQRLRAARHARHRKTADGGGEIVYRSSLDETSQVWAVVQSFAMREFRTAREEGRRDAPEIYAADGLLAMSRNAAGAGASDSRVSPVPAKVIVRIDWDALLRGYPIDGEVCEIAGVGPVAVSAVEEMVDSGNALVAGVVTRGVDVLNVVHLGRRVTAHQLTAIEWRDPSCRAEGCNRTAGLEIDHRLDWADTRVTWLALLDRFCDHHHDLKTYEGWALVPGVGTRAMVPPDDPRHPASQLVAAGGGGPPPVTAEPAA